MSNVRCYCGICLLLHLPTGNYFFKNATTTYLKNIIETKQNNFIRRKYLITKVIWETVRLLLLIFILIEIRKDGWRSVDGKVEGCINRVVRYYANDWLWRLQSSRNLPSHAKKESSNRFFELVVELMVVVEAPVERVRNLLWKRNDWLSYLKFSWFFHHVHSLFLAKLAVFIRSESNLEQKIWNLV